MAVSCVAFGLTPTRWCIFSTAPILPCFTCSCRCNAKTSDNLSFSINQHNPAGFIVTPSASRLLSIVKQAVKLLCERYLNQQIKQRGAQTTPSNICMLSAVRVHIVRHAEGQVGDPLHTWTCPHGLLYVVCSAGESILLCSEQRSEVKFQGFTVTFPVSNNVQQTDVVFGAGALWSDLRAYVILWHGCSSHRCFRREPSLTVLVSAPHFLKTSLCLLSRFSFCWVLVVFWPYRDPSQITGSILCFHSEPCQAPQSAITAPSHSRLFIIFAAQCSF